MNAHIDEGRSTTSGKFVCTFTLAMDEGYGENRRTTFLPIVVWEKQGEACANNLMKGQAVVVEGRISVRDYTAQDGSKRYVTECVAHNVEFGAKPKGYGGNSSGQPQQNEFGGGYVADEEIPF